VYRPGTNLFQGCPNSKVKTEVSQGRQNEKKKKTKEEVTSNISLNEIHVS
jgi:hypothetical protein